MSSALALGYRHLDTAQAFQRRGGNWFRGRRGILSGLLLEGVSTLGFAWKLHTFKGNLEDVTLMPVLVLFWLLAVFVCCFLAFDLGRDQWAKVNNSVPISLLFSWGGEAHPCCWQP